MLVLDDGGLRNLPQLVEGSVRQVEPTVADRQPAIGIIDNGDALAAELASDRVRLDKEPDLVVLSFQGSRHGKGAVFTLTGRRGNIGEKCGCQRKYVIPDAAAICVVDSDVQIRLVVESHVGVRKLGPISASDSRYQNRDLPASKERPLEKAAEETGNRHHFVNQGAVQERNR
jgi:hypothetical protein